MISFGILPWQRSRIKSNAGRKNMKLRIPIPNSLFRIGILLMIVKVLSSFTNIVEVSDFADMVLSLAACLFFAGAVLQKRYSAKTLCVFAFLAALGLLTSLRTGNLNIFISLVTCISLCGEDLDDTLAYMLFWETAFVVTVAVISVIFHGCGISMMTLVGKEMQYNFGFSHPNVFACIATNLIAIYVWLHFRSLSAIATAVILVLNILIYGLTGCRTTPVITAFLLVAVFFLRKRDENWKFLRFCAAYIAPCLSVLFAVLCSIYTSQYALVDLLDKLLSKRIKLGAYHLHHYGISFWGQNVTDIVVKWDPFWKFSSVTFDNIFTYLLVSQLVWLVIICVLLYKCAKKGDNRTCIFILAWAMYGITEVHGINPFMFFPVLIVSGLAGHGGREELCQKKAMQ